MGITVAHGPQRGSEAAGQIFAQAARTAAQGAQALAQRRQQTKQLEQQREMQMAQIEAQADRQKQAADDAYARTALQAGLEGELREQEFERSITKVQEQAKAQAAQWEYRYSTQQRREIAQLNEADNRVQNDPRFSEGEKEQWRHASMAKRAGISPSAFPRDPEKFTFPEGQQVGQFYEENGVLGSRKANGETWQADWRKTQEGQTQIAQQRLGEKQLEYQQKQEAKLFDLRAKLMTVEVAAGTLGAKRLLGPEEIEARMELMGNFAARGPGEQVSVEQEYQDEKRYGVYTVETEYDYSQVPPGAEFVGPDGKRRRKPDEGEE